MSELVIADLNFIESDFNRISEIKGGRKESVKTASKKFNILGATAAYSSSWGALVDKTRGVVAGVATAVAASTDGPSKAETDLELKL